MANLSTPAPTPSTAAAPLFIVHNLVSGRGHADTVRTAVEQACAEAGRELHWIPVDTPRRIGERAREAVRRASEVGGIVVAAGGDGTINAVAQATLGSGCAFGVLPQGTFNYFSRAHGIPADPAAALRVLLGEAALPVQVGLVNGRVFLVNASLGLYPTLLEDREAWKKQLGRSRLVAFGAGLMTLLRGHRSLRLRIDLHGTTRELRTPTLFVGNNALQFEQLGVPEAAAIDAGGLAAIALQPLGRFAMLGLLMRGALGRLGEAEALQHFSFRHLVVRRANPFGTRRIKVATDGEVQRLTLPLEFSVSPEPLLLIRPAAPAAERASG